jgi:hypothetical protein
MVPNRQGIPPAAGLFLELVNLCQQTNSLPKAGGLLDQDSLFVYLLKFTLQWQADRAELDRRKNQDSSLPGR